MNLEEMNVIVTGAASGLGRCFALNLADAGADVLGFDVDEEGLEALVEERPDIETYTGSVADEGDVKAAVDRAVDAFGEVNGLINNAGIFRDALLVKKDRDSGDITTMSLDDWQTVVDVNLTGTFLCTREVASHMVDTETPGVIINISSCSRHGNQGQSNYSATKAGVVADTKLWAEELARYDIRVGAIAPGFTQTPILDGMPEKMLDKLVGQIPLRRPGKPEEIYRAVEFIFECDYFTGRCIDVDGGVTL